MNDLVKRKKELDEELQEYIENSGNVMTMSAIGSLMEKLTGYFADMTEIAAKKKYFDKDLSTKIETSISELKTAFSQIQPPIINVTPNIDTKPFQSALNRIGETNQILINLVEKFNGNQSESLEKLITSFVEKQNSLIEREFKQFDYTAQLTSIEKAINIKPTEIISTVTKRTKDNLNLIEEITSKIVTNGSR